MAIIGDAYVVIHAITSGVKKEVQEGFKGVEHEGEAAGKKVGQSFNKGFNNSGSNTPIAAALSSMFGTTAKDAIKSADAFKTATQAGYFMGSTLTAAAGAIGALGNGLISLVGVALAAAPAMATLTNAVFGLAQVGGALAVAFHGVTDAIQAGVKAQQTSRAQIMAIAKAELALKRAIEDKAIMEEDAAVTIMKANRAVADSQRELNLARAEAQRQIKELKFDSEDAAISEQKAAIELDKARETLARVSDLPPNSRARKEAELAFASADLNYRRAIDKNNTLKAQEAKNAAMGTGSMEDQIKGQQGVIDATNAVTDAKAEQFKTERDIAKNIQRAGQDIAQQQADLDFLKKGGAAADAYAVALSQLSASAQDFVKYMVSLKGTLKGLQEAVGATLFPQLKTAIQNLVDNLLPTLKPLLAETGKALGGVAVKISDIITRADNLERIKRIWHTNDQAITIFGDSIGNLLDSFLLLADAARPLVIQFANWTKNITAAWKATLEADTKSGKLAETLRTAAEVVGKLGHLFHETFGAISNLVKANVGPGSGGYYLLDYLTKAMTGLKNLTNIDGTPLKQFFLQGAQNAGKVLDVLGFLVKEILKIGASKEFGQFADSIKGAFPAIDTIVASLEKALPAFGNFVKQVIDFIALVTSGDSIKIFFDVLGKGLEKLNSFLKGDFGQALINAGNYIVPLIASLALLGKGVGFFGEVVIGNIAKVEKLFGLFKDAPMLFRGATTAVADFSPALAGVMATVGEFIIPIVAAIAVFVLMYEKSKILRDAIADLGGSVMGALKDAWNTVNDAIKSALPSVNGIMGVFKILGDVLGTTIVPIIKFILVEAIRTLTASIVAVIDIAKTIGKIFMDAFNPIKQIIGGVIKLFQGDLLGGLKSIFGGIGNIILAPFKMAFDAIKGLLNLLINAYNNTLGKLSIKLPGILGGGTIGFPKIPNLARGGIIQPTDGGTIARIGEAGKAERVEPLDAQGLSARDRAIIEQLSGGGKGSQINMTINASPGMDERELAAIVSRQLSYEMRRGAA